MDSVATATNVHHLPTRPVPRSLATAPPEASGLPAESESPSPRLVFTSVQSLTVSRMFGDKCGMVDFAVAQASAFATDRAARRRSLSRALAVAEAQMGQFVLALADATRRNDADSMKKLDRAATGATRRYTMLAEQLRLDEQGGQRPFVVVGQAASVSIHAP